MIKNNGQLMQYANDCNSVIHVYEKQWIDLDIIDSLIISY